MSTVSRSIAPAATLGTPLGSFWRQVASLVRPWRGRLTVVGLCVLASAVFAVIPPLIVRHVVDVNLVPRRSAGLLAAGLFYVAAVALTATFAYAYSYLSAVVAQRAIAAVRVSLFTHVAALPVSYLDRTPLGDLVSRATSDVETIDQLFTDGVTALAGQLLSLVVVAVTMVAISPLLSAMILVVAPPLLLISRWLQIRVRHAERRTRVAVGELNTQLSETVGASATIAAFDRATTFALRFRQALQTTLSAREGSIRYNSLFTPITSLLSSVAIAALLWVGARAGGGSLGVSLGTLTAFVLLFQNFFSPIATLGDQWNTVQAALAGAERIFEILNLPVTTVPAPESDSLDRRIVVSHVAFSYHQGPRVLHDVNLVVHPGERVAIVGRTGAGKSTLLSLLVGLYEPESGEILLAGQRPSSVADEARRRLVGVVPQQVQLFASSLRENITLGDSAISKEALERAVDLVDLSRWVRTLEQGLDTTIAHRGDSPGLTLSAGQRQLVSLARALVVEPKILLLDEPMGAVDAQSDETFHRALGRAAWSAHCVVITVAHRLSTARNADRVVVMDSGRIVEDGPPQSLLALRGPFAALVALDDAGWTWYEPTTENSP